jgi:prepilin-type N-terminal cleavage/methylation domain-containing protein
MKLFTRRGFTLIELLAVIAIIGILAAILFPAVSAVRKRAKIATSQTTFQQWCTAVNRYKNTYGFYPNIGNLTYSTATDSVYKLEDYNGTMTPKFVQAMSGKQPDGQKLQTTQRSLLNRNAEEFCAFAREDYAVFDANINTKAYLADKFGNIKVRIIFDTDSTGNIKNMGTDLPILPVDLDESKNGGSGIKSTPGIPARVIIFTTKDDAASYDGTTISPLSESEAADIIAIQ